MTPEEEVQRGLDAERLLREPLLVEAFEKLDKEYTRAWQTSPVRDVEGREKLFLTQLLLTRVRDHLRITMESGQLTQKRSLADKARQLGQKLWRD